MNCPRCDVVVLDEKTRDGVVIDACPRCRGIWLDRGELEKLIARSLHDEEGRGTYGDDRRPGERRDDDRRRDDDDRGWRGRDDDDDDDRNRRRGGFLGSLGDLFD
ncbi:MAG TPA: zf-TFIIB domain-containing protein [Candidatus Eisenbacteria bacterium]